MSLAFCGAEELLVIGVTEKQTIVSVFGLNSDASELMPKPQKTTQIGIHFSKIIKASSTHLVLKGVNSLTLLQVLPKPQFLTNNQHLPQDKDPILKFRNFDNFAILKPFQWSIFLQLKRGEKILHLDKQICFT